MGLAGASGMLSVLLIGGVVCTALSMTGSMVTLLKVGYWTGATPKRIEWTLIAGSVVAAVTVTAIMFVFAQVVRLREEPPSTRTRSRRRRPTPWPRSSRRSCSPGNAPWFLYGIGAVVAVIVQMLGISALAFALGDVPPHRAEHADPRGRDRGLARQASGRESHARAGAWEPRHAHRLRFHRGRRDRRRVRRADSLRSTASARRSLDVSRSKTTAPPATGSASSCSWAWASTSGGTRAARPRPKAPDPRSRSRGHSPFSYKLELILRGTRPRGLISERAVPRSARCGRTAQGSRAVVRSVEFVRKRGVSPIAARVCRRTRATATPEAR